MTLDGTGGSAGGKGLYTGSATLALPVTHALGFQLDGDLGKSDDTGQGGLGAHFFTRDPQSYLIGATAMWSRISGYNVYRYGVEAQLYLDDFTLSPSFGLQRGDANRGTSNSGYGVLEADYYFDGNLKLGLIGSGYSSYRSAFGEAEWQPYANRPFSVYADAGASITEDHHGLFLAGVRYTFGASDTTLKDRQRHGDPENIVRFMDFTSGSQPILEIRNPPAPAPVAVAPVDDGCCFVAGTPIRMADGSIKAIEDVEIGDRVTGRDGIVNTVLGYGRPFLGARRLFAINDLGYFITPEHPVLTTEGWKSFDPQATTAATNAINVAQLKVGDHLVTVDGIMDITHIASTVVAPNLTVYNFRLDGDDTYTAHGIVAHSYGRSTARAESLLTESV